MPSEWSTFSLAGARALALVLGSYLILFLGGAALFYYESLVQPGFTRDAGEVVLVLLMGLQGLALLLVGGYWVSSDRAAGYFDAHDRIAPADADFEPQRSLRLHLRADNRGHDVWRS